MKRASRARSLKRDLLTLVLLLAVSMLVLAAWGAWWTYEGERQRSRARLLDQTRTLALVVDGEFARAEALLRTLGATTSLRRGDWAAFHDEALRASQVLGGAPIALTSADGMQVFHTEWAKGERRPGVRSVGVWKQVVETGRTGFADLHRSPANGRFYLAVAVPVFGGDGTVSHAMAADIDVDALSALLAAQRLPPEWSSAVLDHRGIRAARNRPSAGFVGSPATAAVLDALERGDEAALESRNVEGIETTAAMARAPRSGYVALIAAPRKTLTAPFMASLTRILALGAIVATAALGLAIALAHRTASSLRSVSVGLAGGNTPSTSFSEIEELALALRQAQKQREEHFAREREAYARVEESEARLRGIVESAMDAIITVDEQQKIVLCNAAAESVFMLPRDALLGEPLDKLLPQRYRAGHAEHVRRFGQTGTTTRRMGDRTVLAGLRADGTEFPIEASISQVERDGRKLYTVILRDITARVAAEQALVASREDLRELAAAAHTVREQEKSRMAREMHDELGQALTALTLDVSWVRDRVREALPDVLPRLAAMHSLLDQTVAATRRISSDLRPLVLDDLGLVPAVQWLVQTFRDRNDVECTLHLGVDDLELEDARATALFRILQESLTNVVRHSKATEVHVALDVVDGEARLSVRDNGKGFDPAAPRERKSYGLLGLRERAVLLGGKVAIRSAVGQGTSVEVTIPLTNADREGRAQH